MLPNVGFGELIVIIIVALVVFGPNKLPEMMRSAGKALRSFQHESTKAMAELKGAVDPLGLRKELDDVASAANAAGTEPVPAAAPAPAPVKNAKRAKTPSRMATKSAKNGKSATPRTVKTAKSAKSAKSATSAPRRAPASAKNGKVAKVAATKPYPATEDT